MNVARDGAVLPGRQWGCWPGPWVKTQRSKKHDLGNVGVCLFTIEFWLFNIVVLYLIESEKYLLKVADLVFPLRGA